MTPDRTNPLAFTAYRLPGHPQYPEIVPASAEREWMTTGTRGWAYRCLPLRIANQAGWVILNPVTINVTWDGERHLQGLRIVPEGDPAANLASSMFGYGILTFSLRYLFRTPAGFNLAVRGPSNLPIDGIAPLDGLVESDWLTYPFTMNWQLTRKGKVRFEEGDPICMITPQRRGEIETWRPEIRNLESDAELLDSYRKYHALRKEAARKAMEMSQVKPEPDASVDQPRVTPKLEGYYHRAEGPSGEHPSEQVHGHQLKLTLARFEAIEAALEAPKTPVAHQAAPAPRKGFFSRLLGRK